MKFHIVGTNETVEEILKGYDLSITELKNENKHIRKWDKLFPGTKLKIPVLSESMTEDINEIEPFIEDYYPKIKIEEEVININEATDELVEHIEQNNIDEDRNIEEKKVNNVNNNNYKPIYYRYIYPNPYYRPIIYVIPRQKNSI